MLTQRLLYIGPNTRTVLPMFIPRSFDPQNASIRRLRAPQRFLYPNQSFPPAEGVGPRKIYISRVLSRRRFSFIFLKNENLKSCNIAWRQKRKKSDRRDRDVLSNDKKNKGQTGVETAQPWNTIRYREYLTDGKDRPIIYRGEDKSGVSRVSMASMESACDKWSIWGTRPHQTHISLLSYWKEKNRLRTDCGPAVW